jgi:Uma2 family endonuclease
MVTLQLKQIRVPPGQRVLLENISWQEFEAILNELGEHRGSRVAYSQGTLEIMVPLPEHERAKVIIGDLVKILLDELDLNWESLGSTTFKREDMTVGIEPDDCFYIQNHRHTSRRVITIVTRSIFLLMIYIRLLKYLFVCLVFTFNGVLRQVYGSGL